MEVVKKFFIFFIIIFFKSSKLKSLMEIKDLVNKVMDKKELRHLPVADVEMALSMCMKKDNGEKELVRCTRELLHKVYGSFGSKKLLVLRERDPGWVLRKHVSTRERLPYYKKLYDRILNKGEVIVDLGAGVNGFSLPYVSDNVYFGVEGIGELVDLMNDYFKTQKMEAKALHLSLFNLRMIKNEIAEIKKKKVVFLFKVLDSLEALKRNYSKKLLEEIVPMVDRVVVSFALRSIISRKIFKARRNWIIGFIKDKFKVLDNFELGSERYIVFKKK